MAVLAVRNLSRAYGAVRAVAEVSFEIADGEILGLLGPNGAGKTTIVECILGLRASDAGAMEICGIDARTRAGRAKLGAALQSTGLQDKIAPREALALFAGFYPHAIDPEGLLDRFGLRDKADARYETLSGGQKQRLALALAFVGDPRLVVLDEPGAGLDVQMRRDLHQQMRTMRDEGRAILLTTHDMEEAWTLCDRIAVLHQGRIVATGSPAALLAAARSATLEALILSLTGPMHA